MQPIMNHFKRAFYHSFEENTVVPSFLSVLDHLPPKTIYEFILEIFNKNSNSTLNKSYIPVSFQIENHKSIYFDTDFGQKEPDFGIKMICKDGSDAISLKFIFEAKINGNNKYGILYKGCLERFSNYYQIISNSTTKNVFLIGISERNADKELGKIFPGALYISWEDALKFFNRNIHEIDNSVATYLYKEFKEYFKMKGEKLYNFNEDFQKSLHEYVELKILQRKNCFYAVQNNLQSNIVKFIDSIRSELEQNRNIFKIIPHKVQEDSSGKAEELFEYSFDILYNRDIFIRVRYNIWIGEAVEWSPREKELHGMGKFVCYLHFDRSNLQEKIYSHFNSKEIKEKFNKIESETCSNPRSFRNTKARHDFIAIDFHGSNINWNDPEKLKEDIIEAVNTILYELKMVCPEKEVKGENAE